MPQWCVSCFLLRRTARLTKVAMPRLDDTGDAVLGRLLYVSGLAPDVPVAEVSRMVGTARLRNAQDGISGMLVFDGDTFCQYVEGPVPAVDALLDRLRCDTRHSSLDVLVHDTVVGLRRFAGWQLGYVYSFEVDEIGTLGRLRGEAALACFDALVPRLDVEV